MTSSTETVVQDRDIELLQRVAQVAEEVRNEIEKRIVGQHDVVEGLLTSLLANGHALLVGVPGLAKTLLISTLAEALDLEFSRIQFTPDLMPTDITGTKVIYIRVQRPMSDSETRSPRYLCDGDRTDLRIDGCSKQQSNQAT